MAHHAPTLGLALAITLGFSAAAPARDRPGTPAEVRVEPRGPTRVEVGFLNTGRRDEHLYFELEQQVNGVRATRASEQALSRRLGTSGTGDGWAGTHGMIVTDLQPETEYCFRVWAREVGTDIRSEQPSAWACTKTPPHPPLEPLDFQVSWPGIGARTPRVSWSTPDQSGHRRIDRYVIERQSPPGPNRPWIADTTVPGPAGEQTRDTQLAFSTLTAPVDPSGKHLFRLCAENAGGRRCVTQELGPGAALVGAAESLPGRAAATKPAQAPVATVVMATPPASATASPAGTARATASRGRGARGTSASTTTSASQSSASGTPQPPAAAPQAGTPHTGTTIRGGSQTAQATRLVTRQGTTLYGAQGPMKTLDGEAKTPATSSRGLGNAAANASASGALAVQTLELRCRGGFGAASFETPPARQNPGAAAVTMTLRFDADRRDRPGPGFPLEPGTCALAERKWQTGDPLGVVFQTARYEPPSVEQQQKRAQHGSAAPAPSARDIADERSIPVYLAEPENYWRFFVTAGDGNFFAGRHEPWTPTHALQRANVAPRTPAGSGDLELAIAKLTNVQVRPSVGGALFRFIARPGARPSIDVDVDAPIKGRDGLLVMRNPLTIHAEPDTFTSSPAVTWYAANTGKSGRVLQQATTYHYLITVPGDGTIPLQQSTGMVGTLEQVVKVRFTAVNIIHDSDTNSSGEGSFAFCTDGGGRHPNGKKWNGYSATFNSFSNGSTLKLANIELILRQWIDGPLSIAVEGTEHDGGGWGLIFTSCGEVEAPYSNSLSDANVARFTVDTANDPQLRGTRAIRPFEWESMPNGALKFWVSGSIEVIRPEPAEF